MSTNKQKNAETKTAQQSAVDAVVRPLIAGRFDFKKNGCKYEEKSWCNLPKHKRCKHCIRLSDGSKACGVTAC